nr:MAG: putative RNA-dependent RNA polymerase [Picobirnavirus sp.]
MKKEKPSLGSYFKLPNPGLWAYFKHNVSGQPEDYRPPFWNKMERSKVLKLWEDELTRLGMSKAYPSLYSYEEEMKSKVGPMSIQKPLNERIEDIENYYTMIDTPSVPISDDAVRATIAFFSKGGGVRPMLNKRKVLDNMRLSTNSGSWLFTKRRNVVDDTVKFKLEPNWYKGASDSSPCLSVDAVKHEYYFHGTYSSIKDTKSYRLCAVLGWRGQEGGMDDDDVKQRVVFMMPFLLNIYELQMYQPLIKSMQKNDLIPAYISMDRVDQEVTALFDTKGDNDDVICTDFSKFDQHFNRDLQNAAWKVIDGLLSKDADRIHWLQVFMVKFYIPLICSEDLLYTGYHGMGSGSGGTNFDECMAHKCLQFECAQSKGQQLNPHSMAYGDDGILTYPGIKVDDVIQTYTSHGQEMNASKQYVSKHDCVVLRRWHGDDYRVNGTMVGVYSTFRALGRLLAQERYYDPDKWNPSMVVLRALSILENCKWHPYFHEFIDFVIKGDKYRLGLDIPGFFDNIEKIAQEAIENFHDFLGYTKSLQNPTPAKGIKEWKVVKYLLKLSKK